MTITRVEVPLSIPKKDPGRLTQFEARRYSLSMSTGMSSIVRFMYVLLLATIALPAPLAAPAPSLSERVADEEYRVYDEVVRSKFLTTGTVLVVIERMTTNRLLPPDAERPELTTRALLETKELFGSRLPQDLVTDFVLTNHKPARLAGRFAFGVPYRFRSASGESEEDVFLPDGKVSMRPVRLIQDAQTIDRLSFSRVGFVPRREQALVYVANDRPDGSGAGFLVWLRSRESSWHILDTEVMWTARAERDSPAPP